MEVDEEDLWARMRNLRDGGNGQVRSYMVVHLFL